MILNADIHSIPLPDNSIDLIVTSPPYGDLRTYKGFTFDYTLAIPELYRVTKKGGVVVWVVGDQVINGSESGESFRHALRFIESGFKLHDTMIYEKHNFANPSTNRYHQMFEYMFVFSKGKPKTFNPIKDKKNRYAGQTAWGKNSNRQRDGSLKIREKKVYSEYGMRGNIWRYLSGTAGSLKAHDPLAFEHPATFPLLLAIEQINSWSNRGDIVLDPMCGGGTTLRAANITGRIGIGFDQSTEYAILSAERERV